jgi:3-phosphoshikimate 1-carboxyvinyltransferase
MDNAPFITPWKAMIQTLQWQQCTIHNPLESDDTNLTMAALRQLDVQIDKQVDRCIVIGRNGMLGAAEKPLFLGNSGTSMRLLTAVAALAEGEHILTGTDRMQQRPSGSNRRKNTLIKK